MMERISEAVQSATASNIRFAVLRKHRDAQEEQGEAIVDLLRQAADFARQGGEIEPGSLDLYA